ncbi:MAG: hypothetical protein H5U17_01360 [Defluviimonas sp.]|nr:hypothetical protein [Defluviimonas sp.]
MKKVQQRDHFSPVGYGPSRSPRVDARHGLLRPAEDWATAPQVPQDEEGVSGWWIAAAAPLGALAWGAIGWLLFAG